MKYLFITGLFLCDCVNHAFSQGQRGMEHSVHDDSTLALCMRQIDHLKAEGRTIDLAHIYRFIANYYYKGKAADSTLMFYRLALEQYELTEDTFHIQYCRFRIGQTIAYEGLQFQSALDWLIPTAHYFESKNEHLLAAHADHSISEIYKSLSLDSLQNTWRRKAEMQNEIAGDTLLRIIWAMNKADDLIREEKWAEAIPEIEYEIQMSREINMDIFLKNGLQKLGEVMFHLHRYDEAIAALKESISLGIPESGDHAKAHFILGSIYLRKGESELSEKYFNDYKFFSEQQEQRRNRDNYEELVVQYDLGKKEAAIESLEKENKLKEVIAGQQRLYIAGLALSFVLLLIGVFFIVRNARKRRELLEIILRQQEQYAKNIQVEKEEKMTAEFNKQLAEVQLIALSAQMNPHFLFNCMNSIQKYILKNEKEKALQFLQHFSELMRNVLENSSKQKISLDEEINMLERYIKLEQLRLDEKFDYQIDIENGLQADFFEIPGMIVQPYIENAIWHGLMHKPGKGMLRLDFSKQNSSIRCVIQDNGVGRKKAAELERPMSHHRRGFGIQLSQKRLELLQNRHEDIPTVVIDDLKDHNNQPAGTRVTIHFHIEN